MRRRAATWLIAAWAFFTLTQAFAVCCLPLDHAGDASAPAVVPVVHVSAVDASHDCCPPTEPSCPVTPDEATPVAATSPGLPALDQVQSVLPLLIRVSTLFASVSGVEPAARSAIAQAPPDPVYLRLQRLLI